MIRPYSDASRLRSRKSTSKPLSPEIILSASFARRKVFDISPGQVWSLRVEPLMTRMRELVLWFFLTALRLLDGFAGFEPFDRQRKFRIAKARSCRALARVFVILGIIFPRHGDDFFDFRGECGESWIIKSLADAIGKFLLR